EISERQLPDLHIQIFEACAVTAHVERIKIVNVDVLPPVIAFARPKLEARLTLDDVAGLHKCFAQPEPAAVIEGRQVLRVGLNHDLRLDPRLAGITSRVEPVVDEDQLAVGFGLVSEAVFRTSPRSLESHLLAALSIAAKA